MKKKGVNKRFVFVFLFTVLILFSVLAIYLGNTTGYGSKDTSKSSTSTTSSAPVLSSSDSGKKGETSDSSEKKGKDEKKTEVKTSIDKKSNEIQVNTIVEEEETKHNLEIRNIGAVSELELEKKDGEVKAKLSGGKEVDVTIFPNTASRIALSELRSKDKTLKLEEDKEKEKIVYISEANKTAKILNLFEVDYKSRTEIDAKDGKVVKTEKPWWTSLSKDEEESEIEDMGLQLIKPIQDIIITKNKKETLKLDEYFLNAKSYSVSETENIVLNLNGKKLVLIPDKDYTGTSSVTVTARNGDEVLEASFDVIVVEKNLTVQTIQHSAIVNEKVRWEKKIKIDEGEKARVDIPRDSESVVLIGLDANSNIVTNETITGNFVDVDSNKNSAYSYKISYYTSAPTLTEKATETGKEIVVSSSADVHYTDVLAFNYIQEAYSVEMYRITEAGKERVDLERYDLNKNGFIDYIQWIVPSLSNQTYELIVEAINAEHLDSNRTFISNIYEQVKALDGVWSETISNMEYVRVTFKQALDNTRDITIYPNIITGYPYIQIFEENGSEIIAESDFLISNQYNKVSLASLRGTQDTFDLRVAGGSIQVDYIVDPSTVLLNTPVNGAYLNNQNVLFNCSATDTLMLSNITLYGNWTSNWHANETKEITGLLNSTEFTKTVSDGSYIWNCLVYNNQSVSTWFASNYTFTVDTLLPGLGITYPLNISYNINVSSLSYDYAELNPNVCWYSVNNGAANLSAGSCSGSFTDVSSSEGSNSWIVYMNDSAGNLNSSRITFVVDRTPPVVSFTCDKSSVDVGEKITCSCSATDNISPNLNADYSVNPPTSEIGEFVVLCSVTDDAENIATTSVSYRVSRMGQGFEYWVKTYIISEKLLERGYTKEIGLKERLEMKINNEKHYLNLVSLAGNTATINVSSTPQQIIFQSGEEKKLDLTGDNIYDLFVKLNSIANNKANITVMSIQEEVAETSEIKRIEWKAFVWIAGLAIILVLIFFVIKRKWYRKILRLLH